MLDIKLEFTQDYDSIIYLEIIWNEVIKLFFLEVIELLVDQFTHRKS